MTVSAATIGQDVFTALRALIIANKPTYTYDETTYTYDLVSEYPKENPTFPMVVLNESMVDIVLLDLDGSGEDYSIEIQLDLYAKELHGKKAVDAGKDSLRATFIGNISEFISTDGLIPDEDFWDDSNNSIFTDRNQLLNTASVIIKFKLK